MVSRRQLHELYTFGAALAHEAGLLLVVFAPLDAYGWPDDGARARVLLLFVLFGFLLLGGAALHRVGSVNERI